MKPNIGKKVFITTIILFLLAIVFSSSGISLNSVTGASITGALITDGDAWDFSEANGLSEYIDIVWSSLGDKSIDLIVTFIVVFAVFSMGLGMLGEFGRTGMGGDSIKNSMQLLSVGAAISSVYYVNTQGIEFTLFLARYSLFFVGIIFAFTMGKVLIAFKEDKSISWTLMAGGIGLLVLGASILYFQGPSAISDVRSGSFDVVAWSSIVVGAICFILGLIGEVKAFMGNGNNSPLSYFYNRGRNRGGLGDAPAPGGDDLPEEEQEEEQAEDALEHEEQLTQQQQQDSQRVARTGQQVIQTNENAQGELRQFRNDMNNSVGGLRQLIQNPQQVQQFIPNIIQNIKSGNENLDGVLKYIHEMKIILNKQYTFLYDELVRMNKEIKIAEHEKQSAEFIHAKKQQYDKVIREMNYLKRELRRIERDEENMHKVRSELQPSVEYIQNNQNNPNAMKQILDRLEKMEQQSNVVTNDLKQNIQIDLSIVNESKREMGVLKNEEKQLENAETSAKRKLKKLKKGTKKEEKTEKKEEKIEKKIAMAEKDVIYHLRYIAKEFFNANEIVEKSKQINEENKRAFEQLFEQFNIIYKQIYSVDLIDTKIVKHDFEAHTHKIEDITVIRNHAVKIRKLLAFFAKRFNLLTRGGKFREALPLVYLQGIKKQIRIIYAEETKISVLASNWEKLQVRGFHSPNWIAEQARNT
jgi:hypothetical protein